MMTQYKGLRKISLVDDFEEREKERENVDTEIIKVNIAIVEAYWNQSTASGFKRKDGNPDEYELALQHARDYYYR